MTNTNNKDYCCHLNDLSSLLFTTNNNDTNVSAASSSSLPLISDSIEISTCSNSIIHGRGLVATRDIIKGECLFVIPPTVSAPWKDVLRIYTSSSGRHNKNKSLEEIAETILLKHMKRALSKHNSVAASFMYLTTGVCDNNDNNDIDDDVENNNNNPYLTKKMMMNNDSTTTTPAKEAMNICLGKSQPWWKKEERSIITDEILRQIIRHNAFGPEFHNYPQMEQTLLQQDDNGSSCSSCYARILGLYPLADMINHSCQPNVVRVFGDDEIMMVHACTDITKGDEICYSYIPPIQSYPIRQNQLLTKFHFICQCQRCCIEGGDKSDKTTTTIPHDQLEAVLGESNPLNSSSSNHNSSSSSTTTTTLKEKVEFLEQYLSSTTVTNELRHYLRTGYLNVYLSYMNSMASTTTTKKKQKDELSKLVLQLHLALSVVHNASTEHLSLLHFGYDLAKKEEEENNNNNNDKTLLFWVEQLKQTHMIRYGTMGNNLTMIRQSMQHTKGILRSRTGFQQRKWSFL